LVSKVFEFVASATSERHNTGLRRISLKRFGQRRVVISVLVLFLALVMAAGGSVAQGLSSQYGNSVASPDSAGAVTAVSEVTLEKDVNPKEIKAGEPVVYTVTFSNDSGRDATVEEIQDTLPAGFSFAEIDAASDIQQTPTGTTGTIVWDGPFEVPAEESLTLIYKVNTGGQESTPTNEVTAVIDGETVGPESAPVEMEKHHLFFPIMLRDFSYANFSVDKTTSVAQLNVEEMVTYEVVLRNEGDLPGKLDKISDTLPVGFTFDSMVTGSGIMTAPSGTTGTIVWAAPDETMMPQQELKLIYRVKAGSQGGTFTNRVTATTIVGFPPETPGEATVQVKHPSALEDDFEDGDDLWTPYENHRRANADMWTWSTDDCHNGSNGCYYHNAMRADAEKRFAHDAISMYLGEGSQEWTNYRYTAWFNMFGGRQVGIWFRGQYREVLDDGTAVEDGQWFTGYYFTVQVRDDERDRAKLWQLRTLEEHGEETYWYYWYHYQNPLEPPLDWIDLSSETNIEKGEWHRLTVEVRGNNIKGYVDDELAIDFVDEEGSVFLTGTVGFYAYGNDNAYSIIKYDDVKVEPLD
jgi:uncharacterized repeat protein (TIGR01451 family)